MKAMWTKYMHATKPNAEQVDKTEKTSLWNRSNLGRAAMDRTVIP
jgi:hypothetical protein